MSPNRRIVLNVIATYGRSLYALLIGLFVARWVLQALGKTDYGLMGVVGGLLGFVVFLNSLMATAVGRFYAVNIGRAKRTDSTKGNLTACQCWFNTAVRIHCVLPLILILIGLGCLPKLFIRASFRRVVLTTTLCEMIFLPTIWLFVLKESERRFLKDKPLRFLR